LHPDYVVDGFLGLFDHIEPQGMEVLITKTLLGMVAWTKLMKNKAAASIPVHPSDRFNVSTDLFF
jgi:hypothetical protein